MVYMTVLQMLQGNLYY